MGKYDKPFDEQYLAQKRDEWLEIGLCTKPLDKEKASKAVDLAYKCAGLDAPKIKLYARSPFEAQLMANLLYYAEIQSEFTGEVLDQVNYQVGDRILHPVKDQFWHQVGDRVFHQVLDQVGSQVIGQVFDMNQIKNQVRDQFRFQVEYLIRDRVWEGVRDQVWVLHRSRVRGQRQVWNWLIDQIDSQTKRQVGNLVKDQVRSQAKDKKLKLFSFCYSQEHSDWLCAFEVFLQSYEIEGMDDIIGLIECAKQCGGFAPFKSLVIISEKPQFIKFNNDKKLHCEDGAAIRYSDGFSVYAFNGVRLPGNWVENKDTICPTEILKCGNVDQRAAGCQLLGFDRMLDHLDHKIVDSLENPEHGDLIELSIPGLRDKALYLKAKCPRNGWIMEAVPGRCEAHGFRIDSVIAAQAWRARTTPNKFTFPIIRT